MNQSNSPARIAAYVALASLWLSACSKVIIPIPQGYPTNTPSSTTASSTSAPGTMLLPDQLITSFHQGAAGNCASIAVIKLAMSSYGWDRVFVHQDTILNNNYHIKFRNGDTISLSKEEEKRINLLDLFVEGTNLQVYQQAKFVFAVLAKRKFKMEHLSGIEKAASNLNGGENLGAADLFPLLGLSPVALGIDSLASQDQIIVTSFFHAAFSSKGFYDEYGTKAMLSEFKNNHHKWLSLHSSELANAYQIKNP